jgi:LysR family transcriptional regulator, nitrogen assimilation regulatory protein
VARAPDLRELRYFQQVARLGNIGRAARELNVSQPAVSSRVMKLEEELGVQLLIRHGRGVTLTPAGACLLDRLDLVMGLLDAPLPLDKAVGVRPGALTVALPPEISPLLAPPLVTACQARWPHLTLSIREAVSASLEEWVLERRADVAVLQNPPALDEFDAEPVLRERLGLVTNVRDAVGRAETPVRLRDLMGQKLILPGPRHWIRRLVESYAFQRGVSPQRLVRADSIALIIEMVRSGLGNAILPLSAVRDEIARGCLAFRPIEKDPLIVIHAIVNTSGPSEVPFVAEVHGILRGLMFDLAQSGVWPGTSVIRSPTREAEVSPQRSLEAAIA